MAFASCMRLPTPCCKIDLRSGPRTRPYGRSIVCASDSGKWEQVPALPRRAAVLLSVPFLLAASPAHSAFVAIDDSRGTGAKEVLDRADQARDETLDERRRFSFESVGKMGKDEHQARAKESYKRLSRDVKQYLDKKLYNRVSNELGLQMASLRYDLEQISNSGDKSARKAAQAQSKQAIRALEQLNTYARLNKGQEANEAYSDALQKLGNIVKAYG